MSFKESIESKPRTRYPADMERPAFVCLLNLIYRVFAFCVLTSKNDIRNNQLILYTLLFAMIRGLFLIFEFFKYTQIVRLDIGFSTGVCTSVLYPSESTCVFKGSPAGDGRLQLVARPQRRHHLLGAQLLLPLRKSGRSACTLD